MAAAGALRFVTYNVARLERADDVARVLRRLRPSFACLNEVSLHRCPSALADLAARLSEDGTQQYSVEFFGHAFNGKYGNALLSRHGPPRARRDVHLDGGTRIVVPARRGAAAGETAVKRIQRGLMVCDFDLPSGPISVACTHLDHMRSAERRTQVAHVARELALDRGAAHRQCVLLGDLNALTRGDYRADEWRALEAHNAAQAPPWEPPAGGDLAGLEDAGFVDCFRVFDAARGEDGPCDRGFTAHVENPRYRIDYAFARAPGMLRAARSGGDGDDRGSAGADGVFELAGAHVDRGDGTREASDHFPLVIDFVRRSPMAPLAAL